MNEDLKTAVEALLFASERPLALSEIRQAFEPALEESEIRGALDALNTEYKAQKRGFRLFEIAGGFQLVSDPRFADTLKKFYQSRIKKKLSQAALETLSVIAYRQPVTRADVEFIRGVNIDGALKSLLEKNLVRITGRRDVPGRPMLYGTTREFLEHFGLKDLEELPPLKNFTENDLDPALLPLKMRREEPAVQDESQNGAST